MNNELNTQHEPSPQEMIDQLRKTVAQLKQNYHDIGARSKAQDAVDKIGTQAQQVRVDYLQACLVEKELARNSLQETLNVTNVNHSNRVAELNTELEIYRNRVEAREEELSGVRRQLAGMERIISSLVRIATAINHSGKRAGNRLVASDTDRDLMLKGLDLVGMRMQVLEELSPIIEAIYEPSMLTDVQKTKVPKALVTNFQSED